ncbi:putative protein c14orf29 [Toxoplasma gondii VAND]|uniref:Serine aminopeptidase S33 domain-containing protein n=1 Tax=Toxoplasma gondii VAND TaxID=933077 RepID=A0A086PGN8_TOXGO|nr:putative protein c14orf29 [Toxoplasma gondii VAND]
MALFSRVTEQYGELVNFIIRPPRDDGYTDSDLGPPSFHLGRKVFKRTDLELANRRNQRLRCSHYEPTEPFRPQEKLPCVVYLHGNCSSRVEALGTLPVLLPQDITVFAFDFAGSGKSDGEYVSLGWWEREDLDVVIEHLRATGRVSTIGLWGRSMGAVTALLHADRDPSIGGMVLDSPFASLRRLAEELAGVVVSWKLPRFVLNSLLAMVRTTIINKAAFDINNLAPIDHVEHTFIPAMFVVANNDTFILPSHGEELHDKYAGDRNILRVEGDHNSVRPRFLNDSAAIFFHTCLTVQALRASQEPPKFMSFSGLSLFGGDSEGCRRVAERTARADGRGRRLTRHPTGSDQPLKASPSESRVTSARQRNQSAPGETDRREASRDIAECPSPPDSHALSPSSLRSLHLHSRQTSSRSVQKHRKACQPSADEKRQATGESSSSCSSASSSASSRAHAVRASSLFGFPRSLWRSPSLSARGEQLARDETQRAEDRPRKEANSTNAMSRVAKACRRRSSDAENRQAVQAAEGERLHASSRRTSFSEGQRQRERAAPETAAEADGRRELREFDSEDFKELLQDDFYNSGNALYDMRRPEAAWGFLPDTSGDLHFLASDGYADDEDEIVQRAVALSLEEYLNSQRNGSSEGGEKSLGSADSASNAAEMETSHRRPPSGRTEAQQGKAFQLFAEQSHGKEESVHPTRPPWTSMLSASPGERAADSESPQPRQKHRRSRRRASAARDSRLGSDSASGSGEGEEPQEEEEPRASEKARAPWREREDEREDEEDAHDRRLSPLSINMSHTSRRDNAARKTVSASLPSLAMPIVCGDAPQSVSSPSNLSSPPTLSQVGETPCQSRASLSRSSFSRSSFSRPVFSFTFSKKKRENQNLA